MTEKHRWGVIGTIIDGVKRQIISDDPDLNEQLAKADLDLADREDAHRVAELPENDLRAMLIRHANHHRETTSYTIQDIQQLPPGIINNETANRLRLGTATIVNGQIVDNGR